MLRFRLLKPLQCRFDKVESKRITAILQVFTVLSIKRLVPYPLFHIRNCNVFDCALEHWYHGGNGSDFVCVLGKIVGVRL